MLDQMLHREKVALEEKVGLRDEAGWPCTNYGKVYFGVQCRTDIHQRPNGMCQDCRTRKYDAEHPKAKPAVELVAQFETSEGRT